MSSAALAYLGRIKTTVDALKVPPGALAGWTVTDEIPGETDKPDVTKLVMMDLLGEGDGWMADGSGTGALVLVIVAAAITTGTKYSAARTLVADAAESIRDALNVPTSKCVPTRDSVTYERGLLYQQQVVLATIEIERKLP